MKKNHCCLLLFLFCFAIHASAQTPVLSNPSACGLGLPIQDDNCPEDRPIYQPNIFPILVNDAPGNILGQDVYLKEVRLIIEHGWLNDLDISLQSPGGQIIDLSSDNGGGGMNYGSPTDPGCDSAAIFRSNACLSVVEADHPFLAEAVRPEESFYQFNDGLTDPNGIWNLIICDDVDEDAGTLEYVALVFEPISCLPIETITSITVDATSARLELSPADFCGTTIFEYGPPGFTPGQDSTAGPQGQTVILESCPPYLLSGLPELSTLDLYVRRYCPQSGAFSGNSCGDRLITGCRPPPVTIETTFADESNCATTCGAPCPLTGNWRNAPGAAIDWIVNSGPVPTQGTGPQSDANGDGKYVYLESSGSSCAVGSEARLLSACMAFNRADSDTCHFSFNYHMFGSSIGSLKLEVTLDGGFSWQTIWQRFGDQGNRWRKEYLSLANVPDGQTIQLRFSASKGNGFRGDIALDHLVFYGSTPLGFPEQQYYTDQDGDGYGSGNTFILSCLPEAPAGYTDNNLDCDDSNPNINPGMAEIPCDGIDDNCNGPADDALLPSPLSRNDTICSGQIPELCATVEEGFLAVWYDNPELEEPLAFGPCFSPVVPPNNTPNVAVHTFYVVATNFSCTSAEPTIVEVHVRPQPQLVIGALPAVCPGASFNLASLDITDANFTNGVLSFHSASPATAANQLTDLIVAPANDTVFYALMTSSEGCTSELLIPFSIRETPRISFSPSDSLILCRETVTTVTANVSGGSGDYTFFWDNGRSSPAITVQAGMRSGEERIYALTVTDANQCRDTATVLIQTSNSIDSLYREVTNALTCQGTEGSIILAPLTGLAPFTYQWSSANGVNGAAASSQDTFTIAGLPQGSYRVTITDSSSEQCAFRLRNVLVPGPGAVVEGIRVQPVSCGGASDGRIELDVLGNNPVYSWSNGATTPDLEGLLGGLYSVTITDGNCTTVLTDIEVPEPAPLDFRAQTTAASCPDAADGGIQLSLFGGAGNYALQWRDGSQTAVRTALAAGYYPFTLTDGSGCVLSDSVLVEAPEALSIQVDSLQTISCFAAGDGYLQVSGQGGTPPYRYRWNDDSTLPALFNLSAGTYRLTITDFNGCTSSRSFELEQPAPVEVSATMIDPPLCEGVPDGRISILASGGAPAYTYEWSDGAGEQNRTALAAGDYELTVRDTHGCQSTPLSIALRPEETLDPGISLSVPACVGPQTGSIALAPSGIPPFEASWSTGNSGLVLSGIASGAYGLTLTDDRGCRLDTLIDINAPQVFAANLAITSPSCFGVADGTAQVIVTQTGTPPFRFQWSDGATSQNRMDLAAGSYQLTISDLLGCALVSDTIVLENPAPFRIAGFDLGQVACNDESTGFVEVALTGGTAPYDLNWVGQGVSTPGIYEVPAGAYRLQAFDAKNCPIDTTFRITEPSPLSAAVDLTRGDPCDAQTGDRLRANATGGTPPYQYRWSSGATTRIIENAAPNNYTLTVTDARGCQDVVRSIKVRPREPALLLDTFYVQGISCFGAGDASMTARVSGGSGVYTYLFRPARLFENTSADSITVSNLGLHNQYSVTVTDVNTGCRVASEVLTVREPAPLSLELDDRQAVRCFGGTDGALDIAVAGGTPPYVYRWTDAEGQVVSQQEDLRNVPAGRYQLSLTDSNGCSIGYVDSVATLNPALVLSDTAIAAVACFNARSGAIDITIEGGRAPYEFAWNNGATSEDLDSLTAGLYSVTVTDADNCSAEFQDLEVPLAGSLIEAESLTVPVSCFGAADGAARVKITGGTPPYQFDWYRNGQAINNANAAQLNDIPAGMYRLDFQDSRGCSRTFELEVGSPADLVVNLQVDVPQPPDFDDGSAAVTVSGGTPPYTYEWNSGDTTAVINELSTGTYRLTVTDSRGCRDSISLTLTDVIDRNILQSARLFPNPAQEQVQLELVFPKAVAGELVVMDALGRLLLRQSLPPQRQQQLTIDVRDWPPGMVQVGLLHRGRIVFSERLLIVR